MWALVALAGFAVVIRLTLVPTSDPDTGTFHWCVLCGDFGLADFIANVILFMPLAAGLSGAGLSWRKAVVSLLVLSTAIELTQLIIPGRESALGDIVANTLGAALAAALVRWLPARRRSGIGSAAAAGAVLGVVAFTGLALQLSLPRTAYYGQWTADLGMYDWYRGRVLSAQIGGLPLPSWRLDDSRIVRERLLAGIPLEVRAVAGPRTRQLAPVFSIFDERQQEVLVLGADRDDLVLRMHRRATDLKLREPDVRWRGALAGVSPGDTVALGLQVSRRGLCLFLNGRGRCGMAVTVGEAWRLVQDRPHYAAGAQLALDGLCMIIVGLPLGLLSPRRMSGYVGVAAAVAGVALLAPALGLAHTPLFEFASLVAGIAGGALLADRGPSGRIAPPPRVP
ncbi:MAG TPA: VanZ family protein [Candidatus Methylomirabilis sp.]|nr:VanZ family protein [Candidatus Methylomirabilis sp.]